MHALNTIHRLNEEAVARSQANIAAAQGRFVLRRYTGLHFIGLETFPTAQERDDHRAAWEAQGPSNRSEITNP